VGVGVLDTLYVKFKMRQVWWGFTPDLTTFSGKSGQKAFILIQNNSLIAFFASFFFLCGYTLSPPLR
jgi:hypothetical protein